MPGCLPCLLSSLVLPEMGWDLCLPARSLWACLGLWVGIWVLLAGIAGQHPPAVLWPQRRAQTADS